MHLSTTQILSADYLGISEEGIILLALVIGDFDKIWKLAMPMMRILKTLWVAREIFYFENFTNLLQI